ncbi:class I SAM-dependent methyltransferase [Saccharopolyspora spinosporotrichia]
MPVTDTGGRTGYVFDNDNAHSGGQHRFLASAHDPMTTARLAETGVGAGWRCLEVGAGGGSVAVWLAGRVAPTGSVLATDVKPQRIPRRPGLTVVRHDVTSDPLPESEFDLVVARLVLRHLPQRLEVLDRLVRALKPGGRLQIDEFDTSYEPPLVTPDERSRRVYEDFIAAKDAVMRAAGVDPAFGRTSPRRCATQGWPTSTRDRSSSSGAPDRRTWSNWSTTRSTSGTRWSRRA